MPEIVVVPGDVEEIAAVVKCARRFNTPIVPRGSGTGLAGGAVPAEGGIILSLARLNRILRVDLQNRIAVVEPGVINADITKLVAKDGLFYAPDPSSQAACSIGGNVANNSGGPHTLAYGVTTNHVLGIEVVVKLTASRESVRTLLAVFDQMDDATETVVAITSAGIIPAALEIMDRTTIEAIERGAPVGLPQNAEAVLIVEIEGLKEHTERALEIARSICQRNHAREVKLAADETERQLIWKGRKGAFGAMGALAPNYYVQDGVVPRSRLPEMMRRIALISKQYN